MATKPTATAGVRIASHNPIDLISHNEYVAQDIHQKIELMRYFLTTGHQWERSLRKEFQPEEVHSSSSATGDQPWKKLKHYLSFFKPLDWLRLTGFIIGLSILWLGKLGVHFLLFLIAALTIVNFYGMFSHAHSISWTPADIWGFFVFFTLIYFPIIFLKFGVNSEYGRAQLTLKIIWLQYSDSDTDKGLRPVVLCFLPEWFDSRLNPSQLTITGEIDPLTLKRMWRKLSLFEKHVIMTDLKVGSVANGEPQIHSVEFANGSLPYRDELIASIYRGQQSKKI